MEGIVVIMHGGVFEEEVKPECIITKLQQISLNHDYNMKFA